VIGGGCEVIAVDFGGTLATSRRPGSPARPVDEDAAKALWRLHRAGYRLVLSSNTPGCSRRPELERAGVLELFCAIVESHELGVAKPARAFYRAALDAADCAPGQIVHVGNRLDSDVLVPRVLGMSAVYVCPDLDAGVWLPDDVAHIRRFADLPSVIRGGV
jgi:putative hydrolase of the HAD superfamily